MANRSCVNPGDSITLRMTLKDACGTETAADAAPKCYIYPAGTSADTIAAEVAADSFSTATSDISSTVAAAGSTGFYEATYTVPSGTADGAYLDVWVATVNGNTVYAILQYNVNGPPVIEQQDIGKNTLIVVMLDDEIAGTSGNDLGTDQTLTFSTQYEPYYASPDLLRLECGSWLETIPDDTISLMIHWSSLEVDSIAYGPRGRTYSYARTKFVVFDAALRLLMLPASVGGKKKTLGDLMISYDSSATSIIDEIKEQRKEWWRVVNAGGSIVPGQGFAPEVASKGKKDPDRRRVGRGWHNPTDFYYPVPAGNKKLRRNDQRKFKTGFASRYPLLGTKYSDDGDNRD
tara:strand:- start:34890 stop:35930 length:1041 start_codon:yes stop_codon:yes gene_type:complete